MPIPKEQLEEAFEFAAGKKPDEFKDLDEFKAYQNGRVVLKADADTQLGKILGASETKLKSDFADIIGGEDSEVRKALSTAKTFTEKISIVSNAVKSHVETAVKTSEEKFKLKPDERVSTLEKQLEEERKQRLIEKEGREKAVSGIMEWEQKFAGREKELKIHSLRKEIAGKVPIDPTLGADPKGKLMLQGFEAAFDAKYKADLAEDGSLVFLDRNTNKPIDNPKRQGAFLTASEVLELEVKAAGLEVKNPGAGQRVVIPGQQHQQQYQAPTQPDRTKRPMRRQGAN